MQPTNPKTKKKKRRKENKTSFKGIKKDLSICLLGADDGFIRDIKNN